MAGPGPGYHAILGAEAATNRLNLSVERRKVSWSGIVTSSQLESQEMKQLLDKFSLSFPKNEKPVSPPDNSPFSSPLVENFRSPRCDADAKQKIRGKCDICLHQSDDPTKVKSHTQVHKTKYCSDC